MRPMRNGNAELNKMRKAREAQELADRKAGVIARREAKEAAKAVLPRILESERVAPLAEKLGISVKATQKELTRKAYWQPAFILKVAAQWGITDDTQA